MVPADLDPAEAWGLVESLLCREQFRHPVTGSALGGGGDERPVLELDVYGVPFDMEFEVCEAVLRLKDRALEPIIQHYPALVYAHPDPPPPDPEGIVVGRWDPQNPEGP